MEGNFYLLHVDLDVLLQVVLEEIDDQIVHEVKAVANDNQRQLIAKARLLQEVLHTLGVVVATLTANTLDLLDLACLACGFDVLVVDLKS